MRRVQLLHGNQRLRYTVARRENANEVLDKVAVHLDHSGDNYNASTDYSQVRNMYRYLSAPESTESYLLILGLMTA
jgi:hypothetical protein